MAEELNIHTIVSMPFAENTYVVWRQGRSDALVIDPGLEPEAILHFLREKELIPAAILNTHGHVDHIAGNAAIKTAYPQAPLIIGLRDEIMLSDPQANFSAMMDCTVVSPPADQTVQEGDTVEAAGLSLTVLDIPGHSPGHVVYIYAGQPSVVFGGDVLFQGSIGRYDFPGCDGWLLLEGIRTKLLSLPGDARVYPGHGPMTTIDHEKSTNPYLSGQFTP